MPESRQLALDLAHRPAFDREDFLVAPSNEAAVEWVDRWPEWPAPGLLITGPAGSGKSHLSAVWQQKADAFSIPYGEASDVLTDLAGGKAVPRVMIDDADQADDESLFHLFNLIAESDGSLLLTMSEAPDRWQRRLPDLTSRLRTLPVAELGPPEDELIGAVLVKLFFDRQIMIAPEVVSYIVARMERSFAAARAVATAMDRAALEQQRRITIPLAREVLAALEQD